VEEANTVPLFGGRRAVLVRSGTRSLVPAVEALLAATSPDCRVVIEAGQLRGNAPLRVVCERARNAVALPCYPDNEAALGHLIDAEMREHGLSISQDARAALVPLLGGDRLASRHELEKLALFARGRGRVELADIAAVTADASALELDSLIDAAFAGRTPEIEFNLAKARTAGTSPGTIIFAALRQAAQLHKARLGIEAGNPIERAVQGMYAHFTRKELLEAALRIWTSDRLERAMSQLADAALEARKQTALADAIAERALPALAVSARRKQ
jgi:DNA polymerase-3 subunit delta